MRFLFAAVLLVVVGCCEPEVGFKAGDRVRHIQMKKTGIVIRVHDKYEPDFSIISWDDTVKGTIDSVPCLLLRKVDPAAER